eukprot:m.467904 g.467904  ORF g.467904 m.467904 type:complete len:170 (+) comp27009_c0_seq1:275-784(+)
MAQLPEKERRQPLHGVYEVIDPACTYCAGPVGSKNTAISLGLMSVWAKGVSPKENQRGKILAIVKHPGQNPHEFVAAFQYADSTSVIFIDKNALNLIDNWSRACHLECPRYVQAAIHTLLLCGRRLAFDSQAGPMALEQNKIPPLPSEMWESIFYFYQWERATYSRYNF